MTESPNPTAIISWSHSEVGWSDLDRARRRDDVLRLSATLRSSGVDADLDLHQAGGTADWTRWGPSKIATSDFVLIIGSRAWSHAWDGSGDLTMGAGAAAEADALKSLYNRDRADFQRRVRLLILPDSPQEVPLGLDGVERYVLKDFTPEGVEDLIRDLSAQPSFPKQPLGRLPTLPPSRVTWRDNTDKPAGLEGRLQSELQAYPSPSASDGPEAPWYRERQDTVDRLQSIGSLSSPEGNPAELRYKPLAEPVPVQWRDTWSQQSSSTEAMVTVHVIPQPLRHVPVRQLAAASTSLAKQLRITGLFDVTDHLAVTDEPDSVTVAVPRDQSYLQQVRPGTLQGVRVDRSGQVSAWHSLPADGLGSVLDRQSATDAIKDCLLLAAAAGVRQDEDIALAVEVAPVIMLSLVDIAELGIRNSATIHAFSSRLLRLEPDELVESRALRSGADEAAQTIAALLVRSWGMGA